MNAPRADPSGPQHTIERRIPTPAEHRAIAEAVGWGHVFSWETLPQSLANSRLGAVAVCDGEAIGMGRVVGDGVSYWYIQDLAVLPAWQGAGIGKRLLQAILEDIARAAPTPAFVGLFATPDGMALYERFGFTPGDMQGMFRIVQPAQRLDS